MTEEISTFDSEDDFIQPNKIPMFLKVLCILSWIYVGFGLLSGISTSFTSKAKQIEAIDLAIDSSLSQLGDVGNESGITDQIISFYTAKKNNLMFENIMYLLLLLAEGLAVYFMFMQKRMGFWIYSAVQLAFILMIFAVYPISNYFTISYNLEILR